MVWQDVFPISASRRDAEEERELRLAAQARAGAEWAFAALVARYQPAVTRYLTRLTGNPALARVLAERIFVRMERRVRGPQGGQRLRLWVLRACTEAGLDAVRQSHHTSSAVRLEGPRPAALLTGQAATVASDKLRAGLGALANLTGTTSRQVRKLIWSEPDAASSDGSPAANGMAGSPLHDADAEPAQTVEEMERMDPRDALRYRMVRAVLNELPYGDAQCLALHLVAGLNQAEVAQALGITHSATRKRIVHGLQLFAQRYEAAAASLGLPAEALTPATGSPVETAAALSGAHDGDDDEMFDIADQPTTNLQRPTIVTGTLAAVSPVIRTASTNQHPAAPPANASSSEEAGAAEKSAAAPAAPAHVYPKVEEVAAIPAADTDAGEREQPFVVTLAAEAVALVVTQEEPGEAPPQRSLALPPPPMPEPLAARFVPVLTPPASQAATSAMPPTDGRQPQDDEPVRAASAVSAVRRVPILTAPTATPARTPNATDAPDAPETGDAPAAVAADEHAADLAMVAHEGTGQQNSLPVTIRVVPVVTPVAHAAESIVRDEDHINTVPLYSRNNSAFGAGTSGSANGQHATGAASSPGAPDSHSRTARKPARAGEGASLAVAMAVSDDVGADD